MIRSFKAGLVNLATIFIFFIWVSVPTCFVLALTYNVFILLRSKVGDFLACIITLEISVLNILVWYWILTATSKIAIYLVTKVRPELGQNKK